MSKWLIDQYHRAKSFADDEQLWPENYQISGGRITREIIDKLKERPHIRAIKICGLRQDTFDYFIDRYGQQFEAIFLWKCPLIGDFSKLANLVKLKHITFFWNQRAEKLWDMSGNRSLRSVFLNDFTRLHRLDDLASAPALEELHFGDAVWGGFVIETLKPLEHCGNLKLLDFNGKKIIDGDPSPIAALPRLEELKFPCRFFTTEQIAWLAARLPGVRSQVLAPLYRTKPIEWPTAKGVKQKDTFIVGKGKPFLDSNADRPRVEKYVREFETLAAYYRANPHEACPSAV